MGSDEQQPVVALANPRFRVLVGAIIFFYVVAGLVIQLLPFAGSWREYPPVIVLAEFALFIASLTCFWCALLSREGQLTKISWVVLGVLLCVQAVYEWLAMISAAPDNDSFVIFVWGLSAITAYLLMQLQALSRRSKSILGFAIVCHALAALTDVTDGGLSFANGAPLDSLGGIADFFDLVWTPTYAVVLCFLVAELLANRHRKVVSATDAAAVWILSTGRLGDLKQMQVLARQIGRPTRIKKVHLKSKLRLGIEALAPALFDREASDRLTGPWPELVITAEAQLAPVACWIKQRSGRKARLIHIGRPAGDLADFDLVITSPQYQLPQARNVLCLPLPLTDADHLALTDDDRDIARKFGNFPRPLTAVLVGGHSAPYAFSLEDAEELSRRCLELARCAGGSLLVTTSPRTGKAVEASLFAKAADVPCFIYKWSETKGSNNPYKAMLLLADEFVVTSDSVAMLADAVATGKPVYVHDLIERPGAGDLIVTWLNGLQSTGWLRSFNPINWLFGLGTLYLRTNRRELLRQLRARGVVRDWPIAPERSLAGQALSVRLAVEDMFRAPQKSSP